MFPHIWSWWILQTRYNPHERQQEFKAMSAFDFTFQCQGKHIVAACTPELHNWLGFMLQNKALSSRDDSRLKMMICEMYKRLWPSIDVIDSLMCQNKTDETDPQL